MTFEWSIPPQDLQIRRSTSFRSPLLVASNFHLLGGGGLWVFKKILLSHMVCVCVYAFHLFLWSCVCVFVVVFQPCVNFKCVKFGVCLRASLSVPDDPLIISSIV